MNNTEKIEQLESLLLHQINWFKDTTSNKEDYDDSYTYDMVDEQFGRSELYNLLLILAGKYKNKI